jgi:deoxycytidylate deaminase
MADPVRLTGDRPLTLDYPEAELVFGVVCAVGTYYSPVKDFLENQIRLSGYTPNELHISDHLPEIAGKLRLDLPFPPLPEYDRVDSRIKAGNHIRAETRRADFLALDASSRIYSTRPRGEGGTRAAHKRMAHLLISLKRPEEVETLRKIYGSGFFLIGIFAGEQDRADFLVREKGMTAHEAASLIRRDREEEEESGQRTRDTFELADVFVGLKDDEYKAGLRRFLGLVFGHPFTTPRRDEHAMFLAYAASLRSSAPGRQVGAAITCSHGDVIAVGCNDVPSPDGGLYWEGDPNDSRDHKLQPAVDSNDLRQQQIIDDVIRAFGKNFLPGLREEELLAKARPLLEKTRLTQITEFGRSLHAEMDAMISAGRSGVSFRGATLYTTTFPCHTCTRHILAAGIKRVVYIEPYPKSLAPELHAEAIRLVGDELARPQRHGGKDDRIPFEPFLGIGPRRYFDLFSLKLSSGYSIERKREGSLVMWDQRRDSKPRVPMAPTSYLEREQYVINTLSSVYKCAEETRNATKTAKAPGEERPGVLADG